MVRPVESIRKDLDALEGATAALATEFGDIYVTYLKVLGQATRRQVIMATYHLCTQVYPEKFLALAVGDRARLQQAMQEVGRKAQGGLHQLMEPGSEPDIDLTQRLDSADLSRLEAALSAMTTSSSAEDGDDEDEPDDSAAPDDDNATDAYAGAAAETSDDADSASPGSQASSEDDEAPDSDPGLDPKALMQSVIMAAMANEIEETFSDHPFTGDPLTPTLVAKHHLILEQMIRSVLERTSKKANKLLRRAKVTPDLPESVLEVASDADGAGAKGRSVPNILNVLVAIAGDVAAELDRPDRGDDEAELEISEISEDDEDALEGTMTHLAAVHLRLADIEFGDVQTALWRGKLRTAVGRLRKLGKQYQRAERELAIAQAE
ncbi:MAG: hypothetical protein WBB18_17795, partial [Nodosilinea sp.]